MKKLVIAVAVSMVSTAAMAQDSGWYVGGAFGQSKSKGFCSQVTTPGVTCDDSDVSVKGIGGYQFTKNVAVEFGLTATGVAEARGAAGTDTITAGIAEATAVGILPLGDRFTVFGKAGIYTSMVKREVDTILGSSSDDKTNSDLTYGVGAGFAITPKLQLRAEWQRYQDLDAGRAGKGDLEVISIGMVYRFF